MYQGCAQNKLTKVKATGESHDSIVDADAEKTNILCLCWSWDRVRTNGPPGRNEPYINFLCLVHLLQFCTNE